MKNQFFSDYAPKCPHKEAHERGCVTGEDLMDIVKERDEYTRSLMRCGNCEHIIVSAIRYSDGVWGTCAECSKKIQDNIRLFTPACEAWDLITIKEIVEPKEEVSEEQQVEITTTYFNEDDPPYVVMNKVTNQIL